MARTILLIGTLAFIAVPLGAQGRGRNLDGVPPGHRPPPGMCRIWLDGVPPGHQPGATNCAWAVRHAPVNGRVIYGEPLARSGSWFGSRLGSRSGSRFESRSGSWLGSRLGSRAGSRFDDSRYYTRRTTRVWDRDDIGDREWFRTANKLANKHANKHANKWENKHENGHAHKHR